MEAIVYNQKGEELEKTKLPSKIFGVEEKKQIINFVVKALLSNLRRGTANTKTRGEVRGGGRKPWRQKGTGRARAGSTRSPLWRGGGIVFGPTNEVNHHKKINKKIKRLALKMVLSNRAANNKIIILDKWEIDQIKTKDVRKHLEKLPSKKEKTLFILDNKGDNKTKLSLRNLTNLSVDLANNLNILNLLENKFIILTREGLKQIEKTYK
jgi:large subunit ribosomal protein L4